MNIEDKLKDIQELRNEIQSMVMEKDTIDEEVLEKTRELETLQGQYYFMLNRILGSSRE